MSNIGKTVLITERKTYALELRHFISKIIFPAYPELYLKFYIFYNPLHKPHKLYFQMIPTKQKRYFIMTLALVSLTKEDIREIKDMCIKYIFDENLYIMSAFIISKDRHLSKIAKEFLQVHGIEVS